MKKKIIWYKYSSGGYIFYGPSNGYCNPKELEINTDQIAYQKFVGVLKYTTYEKKVDKKTKKFLFWNYTSEKIHCVETEHETPPLWRVSMSDGTRFYTGEGVLE